MRQQTMQKSNLYIYVDGSNKFNMRKNYLDNHNDNEWSKGKYKSIDTVQKTILFVSRYTSIDGNRIWLLAPLLKFLKTLGEEKQP